MKNPPPFSSTEPRIKFQAQSFRNDREEHVRLIRALEKDFPARSQHERSKKVAAKLAGAGNPVSPRAIRNWLTETATPHWRSVVGLLRIMSDESVREVLKREGRK